MLLYNQPCGHEQGGQADVANGRCFGGPNASEAQDPRTAGDALPACLSGRITCRPWVLCLACVGATEAHAVGDVGLPALLPAPLACGPARQNQGGRVD